MTCNSHFETLQGQSAIWVRLILINLNTDTYTNNLVVEQIDTDIGDIDFVEYP